MSDDPFGDLNSSMGEGAPGENETNTESAADSEDDTQTDEQPPGPAFPYSEVTQRPLYAREDAWNDFEDVLMFEVQRSLREHGLRDVPKRELHEAVLRAVIESPDKIVASLLATRGMTVPSEDEDDE